MMKKIHSEGCDNILIVSRILISDVELCTVNILVIYHLQEINIDAIQILNQTSPYRAWLRLL